MLLYSICEWLAATPASIALHESLYLYLIVLTVHVVTLCVFAGLVIVQSLRLLGIALSPVPASEVLARLLPWTVAGLVVMIASGSLLFFAAPLEKYANLFFRAKLGLLALAGLNVWAFHRTVYRSINVWDLSRVPPARVRLTGGLSLFLWAAVITAGRMIPYQAYWFD